MMYAKIHFVNHGLTAMNVGSVFTYENEKFSLAKSADMLKKSHGDWTILAEVIDDDNFNCFTGEIAVLELAHNIETNNDKPPCPCCGSGSYEGTLVTLTRPFVFEGNDK